jgi:hypothetical protein
MMKFRIVLVTTLLLFFSICPLSAEPLYIEFNQLIRQAPHIVLAEYMGAVSNAQAVIISDYQLVIKKILKGNLPLGNHIAKRAQGGVEYGLKPNTLCIAFLNADNGFEWVATPFKVGENLETTPLYLRGFYDYNAYLVYPSMITYPHLQQYLQTDTMKYHFEGEVHFFSTEAKKILPGKISFVVDYIYSANKSSSQVQANNLIIKDFPKEASASLSAWGEPTLSVVFEPNMVRPLKFGGEVQKYLPEKQVFQTTFWAEDPAELSEKMFQDYVQHEPYGMPFYELLVQTKEGKAYQLFIDDYANGGTYLKSYENRNVYYSSFSEEEMIFPMGEYEYLVIRLTPTTGILPEQMKYARGSTNRLVRILKINALTGQIWRKKDTQETLLTTCTLVLKRTHFNKNPNFRGN